MSDVKAVVEVKWLLAALPGSVLEGDKLYLDTVNRVIEVPVQTLVEGEDIHGAYWATEVGDRAWAVDDDAQS